MLRGALTQPCMRPILPQNFFALLPLALVLGEVTEDLALRFGDIVGGLLNATFGNVVELMCAAYILTLETLDLFPPLSLWGRSAKSQYVPC